MIRPILELTVIIPGMLLAYLPVKECLKQAPVKLALWLTPLLLALSLSGGIICYMFQFPVKLLLVPVLMLLMLIYHKNPSDFHLEIQQYLFWQSVPFLRV